eukprot:3239782-Rhodomonas_salina.4
MAACRKSPCTKVAPLTLAISSRSQQITRPCLPLRRTSAAALSAAAPSAAARGWSAPSEIYEGEKGRGWLGSWVHASKEAAAEEEGVEGSEEGLQRGESDRKAARPLRLNLVGRLSGARLAGGGIQGTSRVALTRSVATTVHPPGAAPSSTTVIPESASSR